MRVNIGSVVSREATAYLRKWALIAIAIGVVSGIGAIAFKELMDLIMEYTLVKVTGYVPPQPLGEGGEISFSPMAHPELLPLVLLLGGLLSGIIVYQLAPEAEGHGTDAVIHAFHRQGGAIRTRVPIVKMIASSLTIGTGGSAGREGPIAQIGAGFGSWLAKVLHLTPRERRIAILCGVAGGLGSIFKAPFGAALFASEVLYKRDFEFEALVPTFISAVVAYAVFTIVYGPSHVFAVPNATFNLAELPVYMLLGLIMGLASIAYVKTFYGVHKLFRKLKIRNEFKPAIGALLTALLGLALPEVLEVGYGWIQLAILGKLDVATMFAVGAAKIIATAFTVGSGGSGGVFAPSLMIGAMLGGGLAKLLDEALGLNLNIAAFTVVGMMSFFSGAGKVPLASMVMVAEMTGGYDLLIPAMFACAISYVVSGETSIYVSQVETKAESPAHVGELSLEILKLIKVREVMCRDVVTVRADDSLERLSELVRTTGHSGFPVIEDGKLVGFVTYTDAVRVSRAEWGRLRVRDVMRKPPIVTYPEETLDEVLRKMVLHKVGRLPVVKSKDDYTLVGLVTRHDIIKGYEEKIEQYEKDVKEIS